MEPICDRPVRMLALCGTDGKLRPVRFQLEDERHELRTIAVSAVVSVTEVQYVGIEALVFLCRGLFGGGERLFELRYMVRAHRWTLLRMVY